MFVIKHLCHANRQALHTNSRASRSTMQGWCLSAVWADGRRGERRCCATTAPDAALRIALDVGADGERHFRRRARVWWGVMLWKKAGAAHTGALRNIPNLAVHRRNEGYPASVRESASSRTLFPILTSGTARSASRFSRQRTPMRRAASRVDPDSCPYSDRHCARRAGGSYWKSRRRNGAPDRAHFSTRKRFASELTAYPV